MNSQKGFANIILIVVIVAIGGYFVLRRPTISPSEPSPTPQAALPTNQTPPAINNNIPPQQTTLPHLNIGENTTITGLVIKNYTSCIVDAHCILKLNTDIGEINILYNPGRSTIPCINVAITEKTLKIKSGDKVEVYGKVTSVGSLSTCDSKEFYIKPRYF